MQIVITDVRFVGDEMTPFYRLDPRRPGNIEDR